MIKELPQQRRLIWLVEDNERSLVLWLGGVLKILYVSSNNFTICYQVALEWEWRFRIEQCNYLRRDVDLNCTITYVHVRVQLKYMYV